MFKLRQFDLQLAFMVFGALGEDIQNQTGAINHAALETLLQITLLSGRKVVIEDYQRCASLLQYQGNFLYLAAPRESSRIRPGACSLDYCGNSKFITCG